MNINKIENRITFEMKTGFYIKLLTPETMIFFGSTEKKININEHRENIPHLETADVVLVLCNIVNSDYQRDSRVFPNDLGKC